MIDFRDLVWSLPVILYAETHYRFRYFFSFLRKSEPELVADAPHRVNPNSDIPLLIIAKDAHEFPSLITSIRIQYNQSGKSLFESELLTDSLEIKDHLWWKVYQLPHRGLTGWIDLDVVMTVERNGVKKAYHTDNYRTSSHAPLRVFLSSDTLPRFPGLYFGDPHTHSERTDDQVEFGVPISAAVELSKSMGLSFYCVTDHSYDLDDSAHDFETNDPSLPKWKSLKEEISSTNSRERDFAVIQGEEVSCRNHSGNNVHMLVFGDDQFFYGSGDGAERWLKTRSEHSIDEILTLKNPHALAFAAHPLEPVSLLQRVLLGRGSWSEEDLQDERLTGIQFSNGTTGPGFVDGCKAWIRALLRGQRLVCLAGNDAHGNFNRFRQIGIPFFLIREMENQIFGKMRTGVFIQGTFDADSLHESLARGKFIISDGPIANIVFRGQEQAVTSIGSTFETTQVDLDVTAQSTKEFGPIESVKVFLGVIGDMSERLLWSDNPGSAYQFQRSHSITIATPSYIRAEVHTSRSNEADGNPHFCLTNPVWISPKRTT